MINSRILAACVLLGVSPTALMAQQAEPLATPTPATATTTPLPETATAPETPAPNPTATAAEAGQPAASAAVSADAEEDPEDEAEIVVTGQRPPQRGAVVGDVQPEVQMSRAAIRSYGVSSVSELLDELAPQIRSDRGRGGEQPVILLNGRRTSGFAEVRDIPAEAIARVDVLPEEVSLKYGYPANQRVVNIVLRKRFRALIGEGGERFATEGGRNAGDAGVTFMHIRRDRRFQFAAKYQDSEALFEDRRDIAALAPRHPYDLLGNITALPQAATAEIDPALSSVAGRPVTIAGVPASAAGQAPTLADFAGTAGSANTTDTTPYRTLLPATKQFSANAVYSRNVASNVALTLNGRLETTASDSRSGLPGVSLVLPAGNPFSPFASDVALYRYALADGPLGKHERDLNGSFHAILNGTRAGWAWSVTGVYDRSESRIRTASGIDPTLLDARLQAGDAQVNPFAPLASALLPPRAPDLAWSTQDSGGVELTANGTPLRLPAGKIATALRLGAHWTGIDSQSLRGGVTDSASVSRRDLSGQFNIDLPVASRRAGVLGALGNLSLNANVAVHRLSDFGTLTTLGYGLNWSPVAPIRIIASFTDEDGAPSPQQLGDPRISSTNVRVYDFVRGQTADVTRIDGGNPGLTADNRHVFKLGLTVKPPTIAGLTLTANYLRSRTANAIVPLATTNAIFAAAFPDRFVRDGAGALVRIDGRPVNVQRAEREELRWGLNFSRALRPGGAVPTSGQSAGPDLSALGKRRGAARAQFAIYHTWHFRDTILIRDGLPQLDLLNGDAAGTHGGQPRHEIEAQAGLFAHGIGARANVNWQSGTHVQGGSGDAAGTLYFSGLATANFRVFANLGQQAAADQNPWTKGLRLSLSVDNIFDRRQHVHDSAGLTPQIYQPGYLDPLGRTIRFSIRKTFD